MRYPNMLECHFCYCKYSTGEFHLNLADVVHLLRVLTMSKPDTFLAIAYRRAFLIATKYQEIVSCFAK